VITVAKQCTQQPHCAVWPAIPNPAPQCLKRTSRFLSRSALLMSSVVSLTRLACFANLRASWRAAAWCGRGDRLRVQCTQRVQRCSSFTHSLTPASLHSCLLTRKTAGTCFHNPSVNPNAPGSPLAACIPHQERVLWLHPLTAAGYRGCERSTAPWLAL